MELLVPRVLVPQVKAFAETSMRKNEMESWYEALTDAVKWVGYNLPEVLKAELLAAALASNRYEEMSEFEGWLASGANGLLAAF